MSQELDRKGWADRLRPLVQEAVGRSSLRQVAEEVGDITHGTVEKFIKGQTPYKATLSKFQQWADRLNGDSSTLVSDPEAPDTLQRVILDPDNAKRLVGQVRPQDVRSRLAILRVYEDAFLEGGNAVPRWMEDLRQAVMEQREL